MSDINTHGNNSRENRKREKKNDVKIQVTEQKVDPITSEQSDVKGKNYDEISLTHFDDHLCDYHNGDLMAGICGYGFERPSPIQQKVIIPMCDRRDIIAQARAGSGKTAAFVIPSLAIVDPTKKFPQVVIIGNTRDLARQIFHVISKIGSKLISNHGLKICLCVGSKNGSEHTEPQVTLQDARSSHILICTPGKLVWLSESEQHGRSRQKFKLLDRITLFVLDEADKLLQD